GQSNAAAGNHTSVSGGQGNRAGFPYSSIAGGCDNLTASGSPGSVPSTCSGAGYEAAIAGGEANQVTANSATAGGGQYNQVKDQFSSISGGCANLTGSGAAPTSGCASSGLESVSGGNRNAAAGFT